MRYVLSILVVCVTVVCFSTTNASPLAREAFVVEEDEKRLWQRSEEEQQVLDGSGLSYEDSMLNAYLRKIAAKLQPSGFFRQVPFKIKVIKNPYLNAFAFPNGVLYIHTGILARMENEAQLAALLGHEMTHCTHRHALKTLRYLKDKTGFLIGVQAALREFGGVRDLGTLLGSLGSRAAISGYSQELEREADMVGLGLMVRAGYDPNEALKLFKHLKAELAKEKIKEPFFFGTHPKLQERMENCEDFLGNHDRDRETGVRNTEIFLTKIHKAILDNAWLDLRAGRFQPAHRGAEKYLTIKLNDAKAYYLLGEVFRQRGRDGDTKRAKAYYEKAVSLDPFCGDIHKAIGLVFYKEGKKTLARRSFETCLSLSPNRGDKAYILGYLRNCNP